MIPIALDEAIKANEYQARQNKTDDPPNQNIIDLIFKKDRMYKHCMYCGTIYDDAWQTRFYQNGTAGLPREFNDYQISTGVGPCCMHRYDEQMAELKAMKYEARK